MTRFATYLPLLALLLLLAPAVGAQVDQASFVPYAVDIARGGGYFLRTFLFASNLGEEDADLKHFFRGNNVNSSNPPLTTTVIPAGETVFFDMASPAGKRGQMGLITEGELSYSAGVGLVPNAAPIVAGTAIPALGDDYDFMPVINT